jgi:hypothetical protein
MIRKAGPCLDARAAEPWSQARSTPPLAIKTATQQATRMTIRPFAHRRRRLEIADPTVADQVQQGSGERAVSAFCVRRKLVTHDVLGDPGADMLSQAVSQGQQQIVNALLLNDFRQQLPSLVAVILPKETAHLFDRNIPLEIEVQVV